MSFIDALWGVAAVIMVALLYRKSIAVITHDKASFFKMFVVWLLLFFMVYNIVDWTLDNVPNNLRVQGNRAFTT
jgi:hypothetical protein